MMGYLTKLNLQAQKFGAGSNDDDDDLEEESLLETPLDRVEPYGLFKGTLMSKTVLAANKCMNVILSAL